MTNMIGQNYFFCADSAEEHLVCSHPRTFEKMNDSTSVFWNQCVDNAAIVAGVLPKPGETFRAVVSSTYYF
jgi:hypothetical protein